jgi:hypothetical protein
MDLEQLALLGIVIFAFMALASSVNMIRAMKRSSRRKEVFRVRRKIAGPDSAKAVALSVINEIVQKHPDEVEKSKNQGKIRPELEQELETAREYYLGRVESRHRALFNLVVDKIILGRGNEKQ